MNQALRKARERPRKLQECLWLRKQAKKHRDSKNCIQQRNKEGHKPVSSRTTASKEFPRMLGTKEAKAKKQSSKKLSR